MNYPNNPELKAWLLKDGLTNLAETDVFVLNDAEYETHLTELKHSVSRKGEKENAAAFRCLTPDLTKPKSAASLTDLRQEVWSGAQTQAHILKTLSDQEKSRRRWRWVFVALAVLLGMLIFGTRAHAQTSNANTSLPVASCGTLPAGLVLTAGQRAYITTDLNGLLCINGSGITVTSSSTTAEMAILTALTNSSQKTQVCDNAGNCATVTANKLDVGATVTATVATAGLAVGVTSGSTSGTVINPTGGFVTTSAPTYVNGQTSPLSLDTSGNLRIVGSISVTQCTSATCTSTVVQPTGSNLHTVIDSGTVSTITNPVTVTDGAGALNVIVDSGTTVVTQSTTSSLHAMVDVEAIGGNAVTTTIPISGTVTVTDGAGALNVIVDSGALTVTNATTGSLAASVDLDTIRTTPIVTAGVSGLLAVGGAAADGAAASGNPVQVGGKDPNGTTQTLLTSPLGALVVDFSSTNTISGAVTVTNATTASLSASDDLQMVRGVAASTAAAGVLKVGVVGSTGTALDGTAGTAATGVLTVQFANSANPFQEIVCPTNAFRAWGTTSVTGTTSSNITWYINNNSTTTRTAPPSGTKWYIYSAQLVNSGATNATVDLSMDQSPGPITMATWVAPTNTTPFGGSNVPIPSALFTPLTDKAVSIKASASSTTIYANVQGCYGP